MTHVDPPRSMHIFSATSAGQTDDFETAAESCDYLRDREMKERALAKRASSGVARSIHQELAQAYAALRHRSEQTS